MTAMDFIPQWHEAVADDEAKPQVDLEAKAKLLFSALGGS